MRKQQRGVTGIGWLILMIPFAIVGYAAIRLIPLYLNYMKVVHVFEQVSSEVTGAGITQAALRLSIEKHFNVEAVDFPDVKDVRITRQNQSWLMEANYDDQAPLFANIFILVSFDKVVTINGARSDGT
jgi:hypothetical protein